MKITGIGDLFIPSDYIMAGFGNFVRHGSEVSVIDWNTDGFQGLQDINLLIEKGGSEAYDVPDYILEAVKDAEVIITQFCPMNRKVIDSCHNLKTIGVLRGGYENINVEYATEKGIAVMNTAGRNADAVADFTVGMIICEARNIARGHYGLKTGKWIREYPNSGSIPDLPGRTVGLIGFGEIGRKTAKRLSGFDMEVLVYDPFIREAPAGIKLVELEELMRNADFVSLHARLTAENRHLIDAAMLSLMKPAAYIINTSRAGLIDEAALYEVLKDKRIAGAALDVFEQEPPGVDYPLVTLENVTVTPHMAGGSTDAFLNSPKKLAAEMEKVYRREPSRAIVNPEVLS